MLLDARGELIVMQDAASGQFQFYGSHLSGALLSRARRGKNVPLPS